MADMWKSRPPPTPLEYDAILNETFNPQNNSVPVASGSGQVPSDPTSAKSNGHGSGSQSAPTLKDQRALTLKDNLELFISR